MSDWQPIETAPKDGQPIDLWVTYSNGAKGFRVPDGAWRKESANGFGDPISEETGWCENTCDMTGQWHWSRLDFENAKVTHWMPLPEPPRQAKDRE